jgi:hypothetical protein
MRLLALAATGATLVAVGAASAQPLTASGKNASLSAVDLRPLVVVGARFEPGERVRLMLSAGEGQQWRTKVAGPAGRLTVRFAVSVGACSRFAVFAVGSRGSRARILPLRTQIECVSPSGGGGSSTHGDSTK